jgi:16S rRNA (cytosine967-C5)-methyltransferase
MSTRQGTLTRAIAIDALTHIMTRRIHADTALERLFAHHKELRPLDRAFIFEIVYGTLRWLSKMDWIMSHMINRPYSSLDPRVANALRVGTYQIYYMDRVPDRAAVSETVEAVKNVGIPQAASFVNAILRRVSRKAEYFPKPDKEKEISEYYSMHYAHPKWMVDRWLKLVPHDRLEFLLSGNNAQPKNSVRIINQNAVPTGENLATFLLREHGVESQFRPLKHVLRLAELPPFHSCEAFKQGCYIVQDEAAQLAASLVAPQPDDLILDACAAPGGKTIHLVDSGARPQNITACDNAQKRIAILQANLERVKMTEVNVVKGEVLECIVGKQFNKILLDAPCSSLGVIRRHPEIKWLRTPAEIEKNAKDQERLLNGLAPHVAPAGELIYVVCSNEREETSDQIHRFLETHSDFEIASLDGRVHDYYRKYVTPRNELLIYPGNQDDLDGFYAVVLRRQG